MKLRHDSYTFKMAQSGWKTAMLNFQVFVNIVFQTLAVGETTKIHN